MTTSLGPLEIHCDAPSYEVVRACASKWFRMPLDVRWCRMGQFLKEQENRTPSFLRHVWDFSLLGIAHIKEPKCTCGHALPILEKYRVTFLGETEGEYYLGQCPRCLTMFWETR